VGLKSVGINVGSSFTAVLVCSCAAFGRALKAQSCRLMHGFGYCCSGLISVQSSFCFTRQPEVDVLLARNLKSMSAVCVCYKLEFN